MDNNGLKTAWGGHYARSPEILKSLRRLPGVASVFNANIDAVLKVTPQKLAQLTAKAGLRLSQVENAPAGSIAGAAQLVKGLLDCWERGAAQEWLVTRQEVYSWMQDEVGYDHLQMGGQGGIIANVMAVCGVPRVYVHGASLPEQQARLFLDRPNLVTALSGGALGPAHGVRRPDDPLIHWILEFDKGSVFEWEGRSFTAPKSNRFIATYDPLNFRLSIDPDFDLAMQNPANPLSLILLSGYQMLTQDLPGGEKGVDRIEDSWEKLGAWKSLHPGAVVHFEFASTQDAEIRKALAQGLAGRCDSVGLNEQETIQVLEVIGRDDLAQACRQDLHSVALFQGILAIVEFLKVPRVQLHMFGLYLTLVRADSGLELSKQRAGMALAATIAAAKAGTGSIEKEENLLWAHGRQVADASLAELQSLSQYLEKQEGIAGLAQSGTGRNARFGVAAVPTILIEKPVTLVGMGDTISSLSLAGSLVA